MANKTLRLILGDQLNAKHTWYQQTDAQVTYVLMEIRSETDYAVHHIQKVVAFFAAMRAFAAHLRQQGHTVVYISLSDPHNKQSFKGNLLPMLQSGAYEKFEYQLPDEYRVDQHLQALSKAVTIPVQVYDTEHFFAERNELALFFKGKKTFLMESFYRAMRKKHDVLMESGQPLTGQWNYDQENRKKLPKNHTPVTPVVFTTDVSAIIQEIKDIGVKTIGSLSGTTLLWPTTRAESLTLLDFFVKECLPFFGSYQDAMALGQWSMYHSRLSFSMNVKLISPNEAVNRAITEWQNHPEKIAFHQLEGFVRQIIGWREYMRGIYWMQMPDYEKLNFFGHDQPLPAWYWTGQTKMLCLRDAITQSLNFAYAHHIQRLMVTGNFALLAGIDPDAVDAWYLGIYIDAIQWVEITNTRGMSQFADGGMVGTKPYVSSAAYIDKMSHYCSGCYYDKNKKTGDRACPFNSLYWNFYNRHDAKLAKNPRIGMMYNVWRKMQPEDKKAILNQAAYYLQNIDSL